MLFRGKIENIYKQSGNWASFKFKESKYKNSYIAKGNVTVPLMPGLDISIEGDFVETEKYGTQIDIKQLEVHTSTTVTYLYKYVNGIGLKLAEEIVKKYGDNCINQILKDPSILLKVKGIKAKKYKMIVKSLTEKNDIQLSIDLLEYFNNDITQNQIEKIIQSCNTKKITLKKIKENPYWLISHIEGFGFKKVDKLALAAGIEEFSVERIGAAIIYTLQQLSQLNGHCYADTDMLSKEVTDLILGDIPNTSKSSSKSIRTMIDEDDPKLEEYLKKKDKDGQIQKWIDNYYKLIDVMVDALEQDIKDELVVLDDDRIYWKDLYDTEVECAQRIKNMAWKVPVKDISEKTIQKAIKDTEEDEDCLLSDEQKNAIRKSLQNRLSIITGGPGRGKTTILKTILSAWHDNKNVVLLAPTGRAAKRMTESTGFPASTIHRYMSKLKNERNQKISDEIKNRIKEDEFYDYDELEKEAKEKIPLYQKDKLIIIDETSMVGIKLGLTALKMAENCNLILVGDVDQLASIEPGTFMKSIIDSGAVCTSELTKGFRNAGSIAKNADSVNKGKNIKTLIFDEDTRMEISEGEAILDSIAEQYRELRKKYKVNEIGILSPVRRRGYGSVNAINQKIRETFNENAIPANKNESGYYKDDRVMFTKNDYYKEVINDEGFTEFGVFNGDTGTIIDIDTEEGKVTVLFDDGRTGIFDYPEMIDNFELAYAITIHKSQGAEYRAVIIIISSQYAFLLKRNLLYTAITRAKKELIMIGDKKAIAIAVRNIDDKVRNSYLKERIVE